ncbi:hypothetical protein SK128_003810 [Halocaridina rubra]|uniref:CXXC motif containing zinc binding protein n=1 Tax=Halocaridina rubra TaxID=373956 RepID=A0AAN9ADN9_HALRR
MPIYRIAIRAQLENVTNLEATGDDFQYCLRIKCNGCNEEADKWQFISADEQIKMPGSQGSTNFLIKCKICRKTNSVDVLLKEKKSYTTTDVPNFKDIIAFECRGITITSFKFGEGWQCRGTESSTLFTDLSLEEDWYDYDEEANCSVGISEIEYKVN